MRTGKWLWRRAKRPDKLVTRPLRIASAVYRRLRTANAPAVEPAIREAPETASRILREEAEAYQAKTRQMAEAYQAETRQMAKAYQAKTRQLTEWRASKRRLSPAEVAAKREENRAERRELRAPQEADTKDSGGDGRKSRRGELAEISSPQLLRHLIQIARTGSIDMAVATGGGAAEEPPLVTVPPAGSAREAVSAHRVAIDGMVFFVPVSPIAPEADKFYDRVLRRGWYPSQMIHALLPFTHGGVMLDVGANIGTTSIPRGHLKLFDSIHAFEPEARNFSCLSQAIIENDLSGHITAWPHAVGASAGTGALRTNTGIARYRVVGDPAKKAAAGANLQPIELITLDGWAAANAAADRVSFVKVDTQGFEFDVLSGADRLLAQDAVWQLEMSPRLVLLAGRSFDDLLVLIARRFDWFIDLRRAGAPVSTKELANSLAYLTDGYTDIVAFRSASLRGARRP